MAQSTVADVALHLCRSAGEDRPVTLAASPPRIAAPRRPVQRRLLLAQLANAVGDGAFLVASVLFFSRVLGLSAAQIGAGLTLGWTVGLLAGVPLGSLADRRGPRGVAVVLALATAAAIGGFLLLPAAPATVAFAAVCCVYAGAQTGSAAARQALLAALVAPAERTAVRARIQAGTNAGLGVGAVLGGVALAVDTPAAYVAAMALDAAGFAVAALALHRLPPVAPSAVPRAARSTVLRDRPFALVALLNAALLLYMPMLSVVVPLWVVQRTAAPGWAVSVLFVVNTVGVVAWQVRAGRSVRDTAGAVRALRRAGGLLLAACVTFAAATLPGSWWAAGLVLLVGAGFQVVGEVLLAAGGWHLAFGLAPDGGQGQYQGFFGTGTALARAAGPLLLTSAVLGAGPAGWLLVGCVFAAAGAAMGPAARWAERNRPF
jgi:MFS family permease